jgi:hypothetical protein
MAERKFDRSPNSTDDEDEFDVSELEQQLEDGMKKLHIQEKEALPDEIQWTEERLKSYQEDEQILQKLKDLKLLDEEITELKNNQSTDQDNNIRIIDSLEQKLLDGMAKLDVQDKNILPKEIQQTENRMKNYPEDDENLKKLKELKLLDEKVTKLKTNQSVTSKIEMRISNRYIGICFFLI